MPEKKCRLKVCTIERNSHRNGMEAKKK